MCDDVDIRIGFGMAGKEPLPLDFRWDDKLALVRRAMGSVVQNPGHKKMLTSTFSFLRDIFA